jgi:hypothetical protein
LVNRLHEEVDLFMMSPECTPALRHLDALKEQLAFHYFRITQHVVSFADSRLRTIPVGAPPVQALCISTWAQCVGYELICELLDSLVKEVEMLRGDCIQSSKVITSLNMSSSPSSTASPLLPDSASGNMRGALSSKGSHSKQWNQSDMFGASPKQNTTTTTSPSPGTTLEDISAYHNVLCQVFFLLLIFFACACVKKKNQFLLIKSVFSWR